MVFALLRVFMLEYTAMVSTVTRYGVLLFSSFRSMLVLRHETILVEDAGDVVKLNCEH